MKTEKKFIICCNSEDSDDIKKQLEDLNSPKEKKEGHLSVSKLFPLLDELDNNVQKLLSQKEEIKRGKVKVDDNVLFSDIYPKELEEKRKMPDYRMFKAIRDVYGKFDGNDWIKLVNLKILLNGERTFMICRSYADLNNIKKINDYDGIVIPCELSWDAERTDCEATQFAGISLAQRLRENGVIVPIVFTAFFLGEHIIKIRKDAEIIRTPALQHKLVNMLLITGWKDIFRSFDDMRPMNQGELKYTQLLYCSLRGMLVQIKHSISGCSNKDDFRGQIKYVLDKKFNDNKDLITEFNQTDDLELFCQKLINLMDNPKEMMSTSKKDDDTEFICNEEEEPIRIVYLEDNEKKDSNAHRFVEYVKKKNDETKERNKGKKEGEQKEKFRFAPIKIKTSTDNLEKWYKDYDVFIADIDIKNEKEEVVALGFEVVRHLIEDLGALNHVYYIVTNVTRSFYDQIKIPGIKRIRLKEEVFGSDEKINRFLYGIKEAVDSKQPPKSDCQFIFDKLYTYVKNESNYPIWYKFNYMAGREELTSAETQSGYDMLEMVVRTETAKLVQAFLLGFVKLNSSNNCLLKDKVLFNAFNKTCENMQVYIGGEEDEETGKKKNNGRYGRGNSKLVSTMMTKKNEVPTPSNVNAFIVRLVLRRFFFYVREFINYYQIKAIGDKINEGGRELSINDLACRAIGPKGAYKEYDEDGTGQTKCLTETLMLTEDENKLESMLTDEEKKFVVFLTEHRTVSFDYSNKTRIESINFNY